MLTYEKVKKTLIKDPQVWLVTGVAGFIGSNLLETLLRLDQQVIGLDNLMTGYEKNLRSVKHRVSDEQWRRFEFVKGDIRDLDVCESVCKGAVYVLHQAALGSVPRSIEDPVLTNAVNVDGFVNMLTAARDAHVKRFVYASSSSVYGDEPGLPKVEDRIGKLLSPYAVSKYVNELYADIFAETYEIDSVGLRYFNVFGPRQDPGGVYAAVIPIWFSEMLKGRPVYINGDGETSRDFCYIDNCVQANILAAVTDDINGAHNVFNVAYGEKTSLNELFEMIKKRVVPFNPDAATKEPLYRDFRPGDVRHSLADIGKAVKILGYQPKDSVGDGLDKAAKWYADSGI